MSKQKNIFDLFRDNQHKLDETPSRQSWQRLERRLQKHQRRNNRSIIRYVMMAAAVLLVFAVLSALTTMLEQQDILFSKQKYTPEELQAVEDSSAYKFVDYQRLYSESSTITEGDSGRQIIPGENRFYDAETAVAKSKTDNPLVEEILNTRTYKPNAPATSDFKWLLGHWKSNTEQGFSFEHWEQTGLTELRGTGYLVVERDTVFMEKMRLFRQNDNWYWEMQLDAYAKPVRYRLTQFSEEGAIFENPNYDFPNKLVIKRHARDEFSTFLLPKSDFQLTPAMLDFLQHRNVILVDRTVRNMWRTIPDISNQLQ